MKLLSVIYFTLVSFWLFPTSSGSSSSFYSALTQNLANFSSSFSSPYVGRNFLLRKTLVLRYTPPSEHIFTTVSFFLIRFRPFNPINYTSSFSGVIHDILLIGKKNPIPFTEKVFLLKFGCRKGTFKRLPVISLRIFSFREKCVDSLQNHLVCADTRHKCSSRPEISWTSLTLSHIPSRIIGHAFQCSITIY